MLNVLFTCAGRRNYLVNYFRQALAGRGMVLAADAAADAPALQEADGAFLLPPLSHPDYLERLLALCREHRVRLLFSLNDLELPLIARHRERFLAVGTMPIVSSAEVIDRCFDKWATCRYLAAIGVRVPRTYITLSEAQEAVRRGELSFPVVIKPRWGTASIGIELPESAQELELAYQLSKVRLSRTLLAQVSSADEERSLLIQERLDGQEFGLDIVNDLEGRHVQTFVKRKLSMRAGETERALTEHHPALEELGRRIGKSLGHIGNLDCDVFVTGDDCCVLELNPRFGGGYPFSHAAGVNLPAALIAWVLGEPIDPRWLDLKQGVTSAKCDRLVGIEAGRVTSVSEICPPYPATQQYRPAGV